MVGWAGGWEIILKKEETLEVFREGKEETEGEGKMRLLCNSFWTSCLYPLTAKLTVSEKRRFVAHSI